MPKRIYLAGPMSGLPEYNYPAFNAAAEKLRAEGFEVVNPAENGLPLESPWEDHMRIDIVNMMTCDTIALLPEWFNSRGATIEYSIAIELKFEVLYV